MKLIAPNGVMINSSSIWLKYHLIMMLSLNTMAVVTLGVWLHGVLRKEVLHSIVPDIVGYHPKS